MTAERTREPTRSRARAAIRSLWPTEPPTGDEFRLLGLLGLAFLVSSYSQGLLGLTLPDIRRDLGLADDELGGFVGAIGLGATAAVPLAILADRLGRRRLLLATIVGFSVCTALTATATDPATLAMLQFGARAFTAGDEMLALVIILEEVAARRRGWAVGLLGAFGAAGSGVAALVYPLSTVLPGGWRTLYALAAVPLVLVVFLRRNLSETRRFSEQVAGRAARFGALKALAAYPDRLVLLVILTVLSYLPAGAMLSLLSTFLQDDHDFSPTSVSTLFILAGPFAVLGNVIGGRLSDVIGRRRAFAVFNLVCAGGFAGFYLGPSWALAVTWVLGTFGWFAYQTAGLAISGELFPTDCRTTVTTLLAAVAAVAGSVGLVLEGELFGVFQSHGPAVAALLPSLLGAALFALVALPETARRELEDISGRPTGSASGRPPSPEGRSA